MDNSVTEIYFFIIAGIVVLTTMIWFIIYFVLKFQRGQKMNLLEQQRIKMMYDNQLLETQLEIQEQTLKNISQEIHDNIGQVLSLVKLNINTMSGASPELLEGKINDSRILISKAIQDLRDLSRGLNTDYVIDMGLLRSIEYELELIKKTGVLKTLFSVKGEPYRLDGQKELILFRIVQEILHNIIKHAGATLVEVFVRFQPDLFSLTVTDNGVGFDASQLEAANYNGFGLGIRNMHNRAKMIGTEFKMKSTIHKGVTVELNLSIASPVK